MSTTAPFCRLVNDQIQSGISRSFQDKFLHTSSNPAGVFVPTEMNDFQLQWSYNWEHKCLAMSFWFQSMFFFGTPGLVVSINLANSSLCFPICWLSRPVLPGGAEGGDDGTFSPSKDASDDTRTCCLPTGANALSWILEGEIVIYINSLKLAWHPKIGHPKRKLVFQPYICRCYDSFREGNYTQVIIKVMGFRYSDLSSQVCNIILCSVVIMGISFLQ